jgi:DNA-directed RNA polymerase subunit L
MELKLVQKEKDLIKVELEAVDEAIINLFITELLENDDVKLATYSKGHIEEDKCIMTVQMKKGRPVTAMKKIADTLAEEFKKCRPKPTKPAKPEKATEPEKPAKKPKKKKAAKSKSGKKKR